MSSLVNPNFENVISAFKGQAPSHVVNAIQNASANTGVDFSYLVQQAKAESSFNPEAKAKTSSASGLYQFISSTWIDMMERHGDKYGINPDEMSRSDLLKLRFDPEVASNMAAEFASDNKKSLDRNWGGDVGSTELYMAHFMGAGGASSFLRAKDDNPMQIAAHSFPTAAKANHNVFYDSKTGKPRTIQGVYDFFDKKFSIKGQDDMGIMNVKPSKKPNSPVFNADAEKATNQPPAHNSLFNDRLQNSVVRKRKTNPMPLFNLVQSPVELMMLAEMDSPFSFGSKSGKSKLF